MTAPSKHLPWTGPLLSFLAGGLLVVLLIAAAVACAPEDKESILVYTAASLADAVQEIADGYTEETGVGVELHLGGSTALARQILRGAPADVFLSAGTAPMDVLEEAGLIAPASRRDILSNRLVLVGKLSVAEEFGITGLDDLRGAHEVRLAIADPDLAPAGEYARESLVSLGLWEELEPSILPSPHIRAALSYVETGNADVGIIYVTDLRSSDEVQVLEEIPAESHSPIIYPAAVLLSGKGDAASSFVEYLAGDDAGRIFQSHGFTPLSN